MKTNEMFGNKKTDWWEQSVYKGVDDKKQKSQKLSSFLL